MSELFEPERLQMMKCFEENLQFYAEHYDEIRDTYRGKYIAIDKGEVIVETDHSQLLKILHEKYKDIRPIFIKYISEQGMEDFSYVGHFSQSNTIIIQVEESILCDSTWAFQRD